MVTERRDGRQRLHSLDTEGSERDAVRYLQEILAEGVRIAPGGELPDPPESSQRSRDIG